MVKPAIFASDSTDMLHNYIEADKAEQIAVAHNGMVLNGL